MLSLGRVSALDPAMPSVGSPCFWTWRRSVRPSYRRRTLYGESSQASKRRRQRQLSLSPSVTAGLREPLDRWCWLCASEALLFGGWALPIILGQARVCARRRRRRLLVFAALRFSLLPTPAGRPPDGLDRRRTRRHTPCYVSRRKLEPTYVLSFSV